MGISNETPLFVGQLVTMGKEIERKFTVKPSIQNAIQHVEGKYLRQAYLSTDPEKTIRIRIWGEKGYITIKGKQKGLSRMEFEYEIPKDDAHTMIEKMGGNTIEKRRYCLNIEHKTWEIDVFEGRNAGLIIAEVELNQENEEVILPEWIEREVSTDPRYFNSNLQENPYQNW